MLNTLFRISAVLTLLALSACIGAGPVSPAFTQRYDHAGASVDVASTLEIINQYRIAQGKPTISYNHTLANVARQSAQTLSQHASLSAAKQNAASLETRLAQAGVAHTSAQEMIAGGYVTFARAFSSWRSTPSQAKILLDENLTSFAIATHYAAQTDLGVYWVFIGIGQAN